ncbi:alpha-2-macroglobulin family protein [Myroides sp. LJL115]
MKANPLLFFTLCIALVFSACSKDVPSDFKVSNPTNFQEYIRSFTTGIISVADPIQIVLSQPLEDKNKSETLPLKMWKITPQVQGDLIYQDNGVIQFRPKELLKQDQTYYISVDLSQIIDTKESTPLIFNFIATTKSQNMHLEVLDFQSITPSNYAINAKLFFSDVIAKDQVNELISAMQGKDKKQILILDNSKELAKEYNIIIQDVLRQNQSSTLEIKLFNKAIGSSQDIIRNVDIPALGDFRVLDNPRLDDDNQSIFLNFSDPIVSNQDLQGLISIEPNQGDLRYTISANVVKISSSTSFNQDLAIQLYPGITNTYGDKLLEKTKLMVNYKVASPEIKLLQSGTILPSSSNLKINFQATTLSAVDIEVYRIYQNNILQFLQDNSLDGSYNLMQVAQPIAKQKLELTNPSPKALLQWNAYAVDLSALISPEPGAIYHVKFSMQEQYSLYPCDQPKSEQQSQDANNDYYTKNSQGVFSPDFDSYDYYSYRYYDWSQSENPCDPAYYYYANSPTTNVLASDIGAIVKRGNNDTFLVVATSLLTAEPLKAALVEFYDYQQQLITSAKTDLNGMLEVKIEDKVPYFIVVKDNNSSTYVKVDNANALSVSNYDVDGSVLQHGIQGYIYSQRGVFRPGDTIPIGFILNDQANPLPNNHPISITLSDPLGRVIEQQTIKKNQNNQYSFLLKTEQQSITGNYQVVINVGGVKFYKSISVETIKPNRLKIINNQENTTFNADSKQVIDFQVNWLQGSIGSNLKAVVDLKYYYGDTTFKNYADYIFTNTLGKPSTTPQNVFQGTTDQNGRFQFVLDSNLAPKNAGKLKAILTTKVFENAGDMSIDVSSIEVSPFSSYVGIKLPKADKYGSYQTQKPLDFSFIILDQDQKPKQGALTVYLYKKTNNWWWSQNTQGISSFSNSSDFILVSEQYLTTDSKGMASFTWQVDSQDWGSYEIVAIDNISGHIASRSLYVQYPSWWNFDEQNQQKEATALKVVTNKKTYVTKEKATVSFTSTQGSKALISIENGTQVLQSFWVDTKDNETSIDFEITPKMAPNVYVHVTLIQPHAFTLNNSPIRLYGIVPIEVYDPKTKLEPVIQMPKEIESEQSFTVKVSEKNKQAMTYTIAIVEEGLLDLTSFKTPNPWNTFYSKTSLGVRTWDIFDQVIGAYGGNINQIFSIGGDEDLAIGSVKKANRFAPVVIWEGPFTLEAGKTASHTFKLPKYIGSVKTMIVASNAKQDAYGSGEQTTLVRSPLMILGTLPRRALTTEQITLPVTIFTQNPNEKVQVEVKTDKRFELIGPSTKTVEMGDSTEKVVYFDLKVKDILGVASISILAKTNKHKASYDIELDVLNPNPLTTINQDIVLSPGEKVQTTWETFGILNSNKAWLELSNFPSINLNSRLDYLISYPHGCSEQITSGAFAQLYLDDLTPLQQKQKTQIQNNVTNAISRLSQRQMVSGGFKYWDSSTSAQLWTTTYVGHFLLEAEKKGYALGLNTKANWIAFEKNQSRNWIYEPSTQNDFEQAYRLYALALAKQPDLAAMNRLRENTKITAQSRLRLAAAYALLSQDKVAMELLVDLPIASDKQDAYSYGSDTRNKAMALQTYIALEPKSNKTSQLAIQIAKELGSNTWMSTQTTAFALNAMANYFTTHPKSTTIKAEYAFNNKVSQIESNDNIYNTILDPLSDNNTLEIQNKSQGDLYINISKQGILALGKELEEQKNLSINVVYKDQNNQIIPVQNLTQSTQFTAELTIKNSSFSKVNNLALTNIIPSGWEIVNFRYALPEQSNSISNSTHVDIQDDRVNFYFNLNAQSSQSFTIELIASYLGHYYLPGIYVNAMYDPNYYARTKGNWINVIP